MVAIGSGMLQLGQQVQQAPKSETKAQPPPITPTAPTSFGESALQTGKTIVSVPTTAPSPTPSLGGVKVDIGGVTQTLPPQVAAILQAKQEQVPLSQEGRFIQQSGILVFKSPTGQFFISSVGDPNRPPGTLASQVETAQYLAKEQPTLYAGLMRHDAPGYTPLLLPVVPEVKPSVVVPVETPKPVVQKTVGETLLSAAFRMPVQEVGRAKFGLGYASPTYAPIGESVFAAGKHFAETFPIGSAETIRPEVIAMEKRIPSAKGEEFFAYTQEGKDVTSLFGPTFNQQNISFGAFPSDQKDLISVHTHPDDGKLLPSIPDIKLLLESIFKEEQIVTKEGVLRLEKTEQFKQPTQTEIAALSGKLSTALERAPSELSPADRVAYSYKIWAQDATDFLTSHGIKYEIIPSTTLKSSPQIMKYSMFPSFDKSWKGMFGAIPETKPIEPIIPGGVSGVVKPLAPSTKLGRLEIPETKPVEPIIHGGVSSLVKPLFSLPATVGKRVYEAGIPIATAQWGVGEWKGNIAAGKYAEIVYTTPKGKELEKTLEEYAKAHGGVGRALTPEEFSLWKSEHRFEYRPIPTEEQRAEAARKDITLEQWKAASVEKAGEDYTKYIQDLPEAFPQFKTDMLGQAAKNYDEYLKGATSKGLQVTESKAEFLTRVETQITPALQLSLVEPKEAFMSRVTSEFTPEAYERSIKMSALDRGPIAEYLKLPEVQKTAPLTLTQVKDIYKTEKYSEFFEQQLKEGKVPIEARLGQAILNIPSTITATSGYLAEQFSKSTALSEETRSGLRQYAIEARESSRKLEATGFARAAIGAEGDKNIIQFPWGGGFSLKGATTYGVEVIPTSFTGVAAMSLIEGEILGQAAWVGVRGIGAAGAKVATKVGVAEGLGSKVALQAALHPTAIKAVGTGIYGGLEAWKVSEMIGKRPATEIVAEIGRDIYAFPFLSYGFMHGMGHGPALKYTPTAYIAKGAPKIASTTKQLVKEEGKWVYKTVPSEEYAETTIAKTFSIEPWEGKSIVLATKTSEGWQLGLPKEITTSISGKPLGVPYTYMPSQPSGYASATKTAVWQSSLKGMYGEGAAYQQALERTALTMQTLQYMQTYASLYKSAASPKNVDISIKGLTPARNKLLKAWALESPEAQKIIEAYGSATERWVMPETGKLSAGDIDALYRLSPIQAGKFAERAVKGLQTGTYPTGEVVKEAAIPSARISPESAPLIEFQRAGEKKFSHLWDIKYIGSPEEAPTEAFGVKLFGRQTTFLSDGARIPTSAFSQEAFRGVQASTFYGEPGVVQQVGRGVKDPAKVVRALAGFSQELGGTAGTTGKALAKEWASMYKLTAADIESAGAVHQLFYAAVPPSTISSFAIPRLSVPSLSVPSPSITSVSISSALTSPPSVSPGYSSIESLSPYTSPLPSPSSIPSPSVSPSLSISPSVGPSVSPSASPSVSPSASPSVSPSYPSIFIIPPLGYAAPSLFGPEEEKGPKRKKVPVEPLTKVKAARPPELGIITKMAARAAGFKVSTPARGFAERAGEYGALRSEEMVKRGQVLASMVGPSLITRSWGGATKNKFGRML